MKLYVLFLLLRGFLYTSFFFLLLCTQFFSFIYTTQTMTADLGLQTRNFLFNFFFNLALDSVLLRTEIEKSLCNISPMENGEVDRETAGLSNQPSRILFFILKFTKAERKKREYLHNNRIQKQLCENVFFLFQQRWRTMIISHVNCYYLYFFKKKICFK